jgi:hypothetical protein
MRESTSIRSCETCWKLRRCNKLKAPRRGGIPRTFSYTSPRRVVPPRGAPRQACSDQTTTARRVGGNPPQRAATTSETTMPVQLKAPDTMGQTGRARINCTTATATRTTMASILGFGTLDAAQARMLAPAGVYKNDPAGAILGALPRGAEHR